MSKVLIDRAVVDQALEALEYYERRRLEWDYADEQAITALRAALEQQRVEQEPVAWIEHEWSGSGLRHLHFERPAPTVRDEVVRPVWTPLYLHPQPPRQPLTDAQINDHRLALAYDSEDLPDPWDFKQGVMAAERAHGIGGEK